MKWKWLAWGAAALVLVVLLATHHDDRPHPDKRDAAQSTRSTAPDDGPARYAKSVTRYARAAAVDPRLVMAILYNESYKPHDPDAERAWQRINHDAAFGVANMHREAFDETKRGRDFADRQWRELPDHPGLAIEAESWYLHDLAARLPAERDTDYTATELTALGYNAGPGNMLAYCQGARPDKAARGYVHRLHDNWKRAAAAVADA